MAHAYFKQPNPVVLEVTIEEAQFLADVFAVIGGSPTTSRRKHADAVSGALSRLGITPEGTVKGSLYIE